MFGMSDAQKLGRAQIQNKDLQAQVKGDQDAKKINDIVDSQPDGAANDWLHRSK